MDDATWVKRTIPFAKFGKDKGVEAIQGVYMGIKEATPETLEDGSEKERYTALFQEISGENKFQVWANAGLRMALQSSHIEEGETVRIVHLGKVPLTGQPGKTVNQYEIFTKDSK